MCPMCLACSAGVVLGAGAHGKVYKGQWRGQPVAVKILYHTGSQAAARVAREAAIMLQAKHENVIQSHHVLIWQRSKSCNGMDSGRVQHTLGGSFDLGRHSSSNTGLQNNSSSSTTPLCSVMELKETDAAATNGWLAVKNVAIADDDDDDVEAQTCKGVCVAVCCLGAFSWFVPCSVRVLAGSPGFGFCPHIMCMVCVGA